jgi:hypothetical protein
MSRTLPAVSLEDLKHVEEPTRGTRAINKIKRRHGADLRIQLGERTGGVDTWFIFKIRGDVIAVMRYFAGSPLREKPQEKAAFYIHPEYM